MRSAAGFQSCAADPSQGRPAHTSVLEISGTGGVRCGEISGHAPLWREGRVSWSSDWGCRGAQESPLLALPGCPPRSCPAAGEAFTKHAWGAWSLFSGAVGEAEASPGGKRGGSDGGGPGAEPGEGETVRGAASIFWADLERRTHTLFLTLYFEVTVDSHAAVNESRDPWCPSPVLLMPPSCPPSPRCGPWRLPHPCHLARLHCGVCVSVRRQVCAGSHTLHHRPDSWGPPFRPHPLPTPKPWKSQVLCFCGFRDCWAKAILKCRLLGLAAITRHRRLETIRLLPVHAELRPEARGPLRSAVPPRGAWGRLRAGHREHGCCGCLPIGVRGLVSIFLG